MPWHYLYDEASGRLLSESSQPVTGTVVTRATRADADEMWDEATRAFVPRPPKVLVDRIEDLANDAELSAVWSRLTPTQRTALRNRLTRLLGRRRFRNVSEPVDFGDG